MKFMVTHMLPPDTTEEEAGEIQELTQRRGEVHGLLSFMNLSQGFAFCIYDAPDEDALVEWLRHMDLSYDDILPVEYEGAGGQLHKATAA